MLKTKEEIQKDLPFDIDSVSDNLIMEAHGISEEEIDDMLGTFIEEMNYHTRLSEKEPGRFMRAAAIQRDYETSEGNKDIILYAYIQNIGKDEEEDEHNQLAGLMMKIEIVEVGEVTDNYLDFMTLIKSINENKENDKQGEGN